jgi:hypothetical protein
MKQQMSEQLPLPPGDQLAFVVRDIEAGLARYEPLPDPFATLEPRAEQAAAPGCVAIRYSHALAVAYLQRHNDPLPIEWLDMP